MAHSPRAPSLTNLPAAGTSFIGRERELAEIQRQLAATSLLTLTGPGGSGKSRLALRGAERDAPANYPDGVWWCDLAAVADPAYVVETVAAGLGLSEAPNRGVLDSLVERLQDRQLLLVLDNCEHLLQACAAVAHAVLPRCPGVKILATSVQPLGLPQEHVYALAPLSVPNDEHSLAESDAARLFVERAQAASPAFRLGPDNASAVATICRRLDGLPLAIELAAARTRLLSADQIAQRLDDVFGLLTRGSASSLPRHQTLRATMDWSYGLLTEPERRLLRRLSVFAGDFKVELVEAVCGEGLGAQPVLDGLFDLADKSLILIHEPAPQGGARIRLLETVRQYAREKLEESGEAAAVRGRLLAWAVQFAEEAEPHLTGADQAIWLNRLEAEHDHIRAALRWVTVSGAVVPGLRLIRDMWRFWMTRGYWSEGRTWANEVIRLDQALRLSDPARVADVSDGLRAHAHYCAGTLAVRQNDYRGAQVLGEASLALAQAAGDKLEQSLALNLTAVSVQAQGDLPRARELFEEALGLARALEDTPHVASILNNLGALAHDLGDYRGAKDFYEESLAIGREQLWENPIIELSNLGELARLQGDDARAKVLLEETLALSVRAGDVFSQTGSLTELGRLALGAGDFATAERHFQQALELREKYGEQRRLIYSLADLGDAAREQGQPARAKEYYESSLARARQLADAWGVARASHGLGVLAYRQGQWAAGAQALRESIRGYQSAQEPYELIAAVEDLAAVLARQGDFERPARWLAVCAARRAAMGAPVPPGERDRYQDTQQSARAALGQAAYGAIQAEAGSLSLEHIIGEALRATPAPVAPSTHPLALAPQLRLFALGAVRVLAGDHLVAAAEWKYAKSKELLFYLLEHPRASKAQIGLDLWPDASPAQLRNIFHRALHQLRGALGMREWITFEGEDYAFDRARPFEYDVDAFEAHLRQARGELRAGAAGRPLAIEHLEAAGQLWHGDFLADLEAGEWAVIRREGLRQSLLDGLLQLGQLHFADAHYAAAAEVYQRVLSFDPYLEMGHRELMRCHARRGETGRAVRQYQALREMLHKELRAEPSTETVLLYERLRRGDSV